MPNDPAVIDSPETALDSGEAAQSQDAANIIPEQKPSMPRAMSETDFADLTGAGEQSEEDGNQPLIVVEDDGQEPEPEQPLQTQGELVDVPEQEIEEQESLETEEQPELNHAERRRAKLAEENQSFEAILQKRKELEQQKQSIYEKDINSLLGQAYSGQQQQAPAPTQAPPVPPPTDPEITDLQSKMDAVSSEYYTIEAQNPSDPRLPGLQREWNDANNRKNVREEFRKLQAKQAAATKQQKYATLKTKQILSSNKIGKFLKLNETGQTVLDPSSPVAQHASTLATADGIPQNDPLFADYLIQATAELSALGQLEASRRVKTEQRKAQQIANKAGIQSSGSTTTGGRVRSSASMAALEEKMRAGDQRATEEFISRSISGYYDATVRRKA